jgi:hypothetical protein
MNLLETVYTASDIVQNRWLPYRTHQKMGNRLCISLLLNAPGMCRRVIKSEVVRHAMNCSALVDFKHMVMYVTPAGKGFFSGVVMQVAREG